MYYEILDEEKKKVFSGGQSLLYKMPNYGNGRRP
jgi:hypothetical protein